MGRMVFVCAAFFWRCVCFVRARLSGGGVFSRERGCAHRRALRGGKVDAAGVVQGRGEPEAAAAAPPLLLGERLLGRGRRRAFERRRASSALYGRVEGRRFGAAARAAARRRIRAKEDGGRARRRRGGSSRMDDGARSGSQASPRAQHGEAVRALRRRRMRERRGAAQAEVPRRLRRAGALARRSARARSIDGRKGGAQGLQLQGRLGTRRRAGLAPGAAAPRSRGRAALFGARGLGARGKQSRRLL
mmetsp:Transcript_14144/g.47198  ORF Transcript_14144/g.47198 Transcript_14144/m.47198 type:complete len:247 (-) Transcript_14144:1896-2636(-)